ncbi:hypothetical protein NEF87_003888 [Candidatus Lokiarchaeum ossiferum]|uniref:CheW-like domain-containing protein n=1 Tax=Candidatus Lokiarchaeum ossiferum TaxID=2951803 RepID=A0ABY6HVP8_9ARCH|nr:hypothetical protein NEF87_003888 [Candidatus Lokiarchaeum sp. B-35]
MDETVSQILQIEHFSFHIQNQPYCIPLEHIHEVIPAPYITKIPSHNEFVKGIINYRGIIVELLDFPLFLGFDEPVNSFTKIIIYKKENLLKGILIGKKVRILRGLIQTFPLPILFKNMPNSLLIQQVLWDEHTLFYELNMNHHLFS